MSMSVLVQSLLHINSNHVFKNYKNPLLFIHISTISFRKMSYANLNYSYLVPFPMEYCPTPSITIEDPAWTIPLSFNFTFPEYDKELTAQLYTPLVESYSFVTDSSTDSCSDSCAASLVNVSTPMVSPLAIHKIAPEASPCGTSYKQPSHADISDKCLVAQSLRERKKWEELKYYISETSFAVSDHSFLQNFFYEAVYEIYKIERGLKRLTPPQRYRLRKTNPLPSSICSTKFRSNNHLDDNARSLLESVFKKNRFPSPEMVQNLVENTGLSAKQVKNYFKNNRSRK